MNHRLDTDTQVFFYCDEFYCLSNFAAFKVYWQRRLFDTAEHAYHWAKFPLAEHEIRIAIMIAKSAHEAFKIAQEDKKYIRPDWPDVRVDIMREILRAKVEQHEYVRRKLLETGNREIVEDSWRDRFWGWGSDGNGLNMLGKLWMEIRDELRNSSQDTI